MEDKLSMGRRFRLPTIVAVPSISIKHLICIITALFFLSSCSARHVEVNNLATSLNYTNPALILTKLQATDPPVRDLAQHHLDLGMLNFILGNFDKAIKNFALAKKEMAALDALSVTETAASATINDTLSSYSGSPTDKVMVYNLLALSYLFSNDIDAARVEVLQADVMIKKLSKQKSLSAQLASAHLISGIIFELLGENDDAFVSYKYAASILNERGQALSTGLKLALLRQSYTLGLSDQHVQYKRQFNDIDYQAAESNQIFMLYFDGIVSSKKQISITAINPDNDQVMRIAMPTYAVSRYHSTQASIHSNDTTYSSEIIEDLEPIVREDLNDIYPRILATSTARAILKYNAVKQTKKQDSLLGVLLNIAAVLTESADLRSWNMLPSNIQFAYLESNQDAINLSAPKLNNHLVNIKGQSQNLVLISSLTGTPFIYTQNKSSN